MTNCDCIIHTLGTVLTFISYYLLSEVVDLRLRELLVDKYQSLAFYNIE